MFEAFDGESNSSLKSVAERPELAVHIGLIIGMWAVVESQLSHLLSIILQSDAKIGATLFSVIKAESGRLAMIDAIADDRFTLEQKTEYEALQKRVKSVGKYRDTIAHNIWGVSTTCPNSLILFDARKSARWMASFTSNLADPLRHDKSLTENQKSHRALILHMTAEREYANSAREYTEKEFLHIESEITQLSFDLGQFASKLHPPLHLQNGSGFV